MVISDAVAFPPHIQFAGSGSEAIPILITKTFNNTKSKVVELAQEIVVKLIEVRAVVSRQPGWLALVDGRHGRLGARQVVFAYSPHGCSDPVRVMGPVAGGGTVAHVRAENSQPFVLPFRRCPIDGADFCRL